MQPAKSSRQLPAATGSASPPLPPARPGNVFPPGPRGPSAFPSPPHPSPRHRSSSDHRHAHPQGPQTQPFKPSPLRSSLVASAEDAPGRTRPGTDAGTPLRRDGPRSTQGLTSETVSFNHELDKEIIAMRDSNRNNAASFERNVISRRSNPDDLAKYLGQSDPPSQPDIQQIMDYLSKWEASLERMLARLKEDSLIQPTSEEASSGSNVVDPAVVRHTVHPAFPDIPVLDEEAKCHWQETVNSIMHTYQYRDESLDYLLKWYKHLRGFEEALKSFGERIEGCIAEKALIHELRQQLAAKEAVLHAFTINGMTPANDVPASEATESVLSSAVGPHPPPSAVQEAVPAIHATHSTNSSCSGSDDKRAAPRGSDFGTGHAL